MSAFNGIEFGYFTDSWTRDLELAHYRDIDGATRRFFPGMTREQGSRASDLKRKRSEETEILEVDEQKDDDVSSIKRKEGGAMPEVVVGVTRGKEEMSGRVDGPSRQGRQSSQGRRGRQSRAQSMSQGARKMQRTRRTRRDPQGLADKENVLRQDQQEPLVVRGQSSVRTQSCADLRADIKTMHIPVNTSRLSRRELAQVIVDHVPSMTVSQLVTMCHKKRLSLEKLTRGPKKKDYINLLVSHYE